MGEAAPDIPILLDETNIIKFFELTGKYVYAILGLVLEEHQSICSESVEANDITRWMKNATNCTDPTDFDQATEEAIAAMLSRASDIDNPLLVDVRKPSDLTCTNYAWPGDFPAPLYQSRSKSVIRAILKFILISTTSTMLPAGWDRIQVAQRRLPSGQIPIYMPAGI